MRPSVGKSVIVLSLALTFLSGCGMPRDGSAPNGTGSASAGATLRFVEPWTQEGRSANHASSGGSGPIPPLRHAWDFQRSAPSPLLGLNLSKGVNPPVAALGTVLVFSGDVGTLFALDGRGRIRWSHRAAGLDDYVEGPVISPPNVLLATVAEDGGGVTVRAFDIRTGSLKWTWSRKEAAAAVAVAATRDRVLVTVPGRRRSVTLLTSTGQEVWTTSTRGRSRATTPTLGTNIAVVPTTAGIEALHLDDGRPLWSAPAGEPNLGPPALSENRVFAGLRGSGVFVYSAMTGERLRQLGDPKSFLAFAVSDDRIFVRELRELREPKLRELPDLRERIVMFDTGTLQQIGEVTVPKTGWSIDAFVPVNDDLLAVVSDNSSGADGSARLLLLRAGTGIAWSGDAIPATKDSSVSDLIVTGDAAIVTTDDGRMDVYSHAG